MKKITIFISVVLLLFITPRTAMAAVDEETEVKAMLAYCNILEKKTIKWGDHKYKTNTLEFAFVDVNKDGLKEMILYNDGASHAEGWFRIYTYKGGKAKSLGSFTNISIYRNKNYIVDIYSNYGNTTISFYRLKNGKRVSLASYIISQTKPKTYKGKLVKKQFDEDVFYFWNINVNGEKSTYKKCMKVINNLTKDAEQTTLSWKKNNGSYKYIVNKEDSHKYNKKTYFTGYLDGDAYPNIYQKSGSTTKMIQFDAHIIGAKGKYILTEGNQGDYGPVRIYVINAKTGKVKSISKNAWGIGTAAKISGAYVYYPEFSKYEYNSYTFKIKRYKLSNGKKKTLTKKISCNGVIKYTSKYVQYRKGSAQYIYYYSSGKIKKVTPQSTTNTNTTTSNNTTSNTTTNTTTTTVQPSIKISTGSTGANTCTLTATTVPSGAAVTWKSSNSSVASVSGGKVTAKAAGTAKITASITYGGKTYTASKTVTVAAKKSYGSWSNWSTNAVSAMSTREVRTTTLYRYYYFYCPVCGGREPLQGMSDCHQYSLSLSDAHAGWFTTPYSQSNSVAYSYASYKRYTTLLGDGKLWNFSTGNINHTAIGTKDTDSDAVVITTGYSYRNVATSYYVQTVK